MCKCAESNDPSAMTNSPGANDVLVQMANHYRATGPATGRKYPKPNGQNILYMDIADAQALSRHAKANKRVTILPNPAVRLLVLHPIVGANSSGYTTILLQVPARCELWGG